jgi:cytochrome c oxidase subunit 2
MPVLRRVRAYAPLAAVALLVGCGDALDRHPQSTFESEGPPARAIQNLSVPVFAAAGVVFVVILGACLLIPLKFRAKGDDDEEIPRQVHGNTRLEITWTIVPALILAVVGVATVVSIFDLSADAEEGSLKVEVIGQQWWWEYRYDLDDDGKFDEITTANDLVIPAGRDIDLTITARDVIHSFWAPKLNGKRDAVPGREHPWSIEADQPGEYLGQCTEYCGLSHAEMRIKVIALSEDDFATWAEGQQQTAKRYGENDMSAAAEGYRVFTQQLCSSCHVIEGVNAGDRERFTPDGRIKDRVLQVSGYAPNLTHLMSRTTFAGAKFDLRKDTPACRALGVDWAADPEGRARCLDRAALEAWLRNPTAEKAMAPDGVPGRTEGRGMPNLELSEAQIDQLVAYLETLK